MCKVTPAGRKSYFLYYRTKEKRQRCPKIGDYGVLTAEQARSIAQQWLLLISQGKDPSAEKQEVQVIPTVKELSEKYIREHAPHKKASAKKKISACGSSLSSRLLGP